MRHSALWRCCYSTLIVIYAKCRYPECRYAECRYAECRYAECRGTVKLELTNSFISVAEISSFLRKRQKRLSLRVI
jgi:hypothetical protein